MSEANQREELKKSKSIQEFQMFKKQPSAERTKISSLAKQCKFEKGQCIVNEGDPVTSFYLIIEGDFERLKNIYVPAAPNLRHKKSTENEIFYEYNPLEVKDEIITHPEFQ